MAAYDKYLPDFVSLSEACYRNLIVFRTNMQIAKKS
jgi:hypothetical protein